MSEAFGVFGDKVLPSSAVRQQRAMAVVYAVSGVSWILKTDHSKKICHVWHWVLGRQLIVLRKNILTLSDITSFKLFLYVYMHTYILSYMYV